MRNFIQSSIVAAAALVIANPASALTIGTVIDGGNTVNTSFTTTGLAAVDVQFNGLNINPVTIDFEVEASEAGGSVAFSSFLENFAGENILQLGLTLSGGATFDLVGDILPAFSIATVESQTGDEVLISFDPGEGADIALGDPFVAGGTDWEIGLAGLGAGDTFSLTLTAVPEPASFALLGAGLIALGGTTRRRNSAV